MTGSIFTLKRSPYFSAVALSVSLLLLTGQTFTCCLLNESLSAKVQRLWNSVTGTEPTAAHAKAGEPDRHPSCHGQNLDPSSPHAAAGDFSNGAGTFLKPDGRCLSKLAFASEGMASAEFELLAPPAQSLLSHTIPIPAIAAVDKPRPQNKAGPPLYLFTLHILV